MPRAEFKGVRLVAINVEGMNTTVNFPDVETFATFMSMKDACNGVVQGTLDLRTLPVPEAKGKPDK